MISCDFVRFCTPLLARRVVLCDLLYFFCDFVRARINEENFSNRFKSTFFMNRLEVSYDWSKNESPRRRL